MSWQKLTCAVPEFTMGNITQYFVNRITSYDNKPSNDIKNISKHAYPLFRAGNVQKIEVMIDSTHHHYRCICLPEMKKGIVYNVNLRIDKATTDITYASCECPAGRGPHGSCKHIAATAFALEDYSRSKPYAAASGNSESCTSRLQTWNQPRKRHLDPVSVKDIDFCNVEYGKVKRKMSNMLYDPRPSKLQCTSNDEIETLRCNLLSHFKAPPALVQLLTPIINDSPETIVSTPSSVRDMIISKLKSHPLSLTDIKSAGSEFIASLQTDATSVEFATRLQHMSSRWHSERKFRITASNFGIVAKRRAPNPPLVRRLLYASTIEVTAAALEWGRSHEDEARRKYEESLEPECSIQQCGLFVHENGFLGASPDGVVLNNSCKDRLKID